MPSTGKRHWLGKFGLMAVAVMGSQIPSLLAPTSASANILETAIHPAFDIKQIPLPDMYRTMGIGFLSDGRMVLVTTGIMGGGEVPKADANSCVFLVSGVK